MADQQESRISGLRAVELYFRVIRDISNGAAAFLHTQTRLNAPSLGVLFPEQFRRIDKILRIDIQSNSFHCNFSLSFLFSVVVPLPQQPQPP